MKGKTQFVVFLTGPGGTGKSRVIDGVRDYAKSLCKQLDVKFDQRTIITTALTGTAAVNIKGETTASACQIKKNKENLDKEQDYKNSTS